MTSRERVAAALRREEPDRVPYCEEYVSRPFAERLLGWGHPESDAVNLEDNEFTVDEYRELAAHLGLDNLTYVLRAPVYADKRVGQDGILFYGDGHIRSLEDLDRVRLPDPFDDRLYDEAAAFAERAGDYSAWFNTRIGIFSTMLSMGIEGFSLALYDNPTLVERLLDRYVEWIEVVAGRACGLGFDVFISTDDFAFNTGPFFSPQVFRELVLPLYRRVSGAIRLPWIIHSDGNIAPLLDDLLSVGVVATHPNEPQAMDIRDVKRRYGDRLCVLGNVDLTLLSLGTPEEAEQEVRGLIRDLGPGGGYILTSGNSLTGYCRAENVRAMSAAVRTYGGYPITI